MNLTSLRTIVRKLTSTQISVADGGTITNGDPNLLDATINLYLSNAAHLLSAEVTQGNDDWDFQGDYATTTLQAGQREYVFPLDILIIKRIEAQLDGVNWRRLKPINESQIHTNIADEASIISRFNNNNPYFSTIERSLYIYSGTIVSTIAGLKIWYTKEVVGKTVSGLDITLFSNPTDIPNLAAGYQEGLCYFAAKKFFEGLGMSKRAQDMSTEMEKIILRMRSHYAQRIEPRGLNIDSASRLENYE